VARSRPAIPSRARGPPADPHFIHGSCEARSAQTLPSRVAASSNPVAPSPLPPPLPAAASAPRPPSAPPLASPSPLPIASPSPLPIARSRVQPPTSSSALSRLSSSPQSPLPIRRLFSMQRLGMARTGCVSCEGARAAVEEASVVVARMKQGRMASVLSSSPSQRAAARRAERLGRRSGASHSSCSGRAAAACHGPGG
jgi:hypothetical protein